MAKQLHKRFSAEEVKTLFRKYLYEGIELIYILETLKIRKSRFFDLGIRHFLQARARQLELRACGY